jgi:alpha-galactosidase
MRPVTFQAKGLPDGLMLDPQTGIIRGTPSRVGNYAVSLTVSNSYGKVQRTLEIIVGEQLAYTPPMGYLSWNWVEGTINETFLKELADAFVTAGLRDVGYQYINMDDSWQGKRDVNGYITPDIHRFPNGMKTVCDYLHEKGFKFGIYSSPGAFTCSHYAGSLGFEKQDVETWVSWGVDYLKYDHCSCLHERQAELYALMGNLLKTSGRSITYCYCGYFVQTAKEVGCHLWRTGGDLRDTWGKLTGYNGTGIVESFEKAQQYAGEQSAGGWNDPDMLVAGLYGKGGSGSDLTDVKGCTDTEYRSQVSLWALMSAPLFVSADIRRINKNTLETLTNPEVIDVDQDVLGNFPQRIGNAGEQEVWVKQMADGSKTVALFNKASTPVKMAVRWTDIDIKGRHPVRDLWQRKDMGTFGKEYTDTVSSHGVTLIRIFNKR